MRIIRAMAAAATICAAALSTACVSASGYNQYTVPNDDCQRANVSVFWDTGIAARDVSPLDPAEPDWNPKKAKVTYDTTNAKGKEVPDKAGAHLTIKVSDDGKNVTWTAAPGTRVVCTTWQVYKMMGPGHLEGGNHKTDPLSKLYQPKPGQGIEPYTELPPLPKGYHLAYVVISAYAEDVPERKNW